MGGRGSLRVLGEGVGLGRGRLGIRWGCEIGCVVGCFLVLFWETLFLATRLFWFILLLLLWLSSTI